MVQTDNVPSVGTHPWVDGPFDNEEKDRRIQLWQSMVSTAMFNPIMPAQNGWQRSFTILRKYRRVIQPSSPFGSGDVVDKNPHNHVLRIKYVDNTTRDYQWASSPAGSDTAALTAQWTPRFGSQSEVQNEPNSKAKLFLIVRAMNTTAVALADSSAANTPSYDIVLRRKVSFYHER